MTKPICAKHGESKTLRCKHCDRENPFPKSKSTKAHLRWIYRRLRDYYGEDPDCDYMLKLEDIIHDAKVKG